jgi:tryptophan synthase alpha chain
MTKTRIGQLFSKKNARILSVYCTGGYPQLDSTIEILKVLQENGADMIELGMPYSDPLADGPVIQQSGTIALQNGMTIQQLFGQLKDIRKTIHVPVILMGYMNPVLQYGFEKFCADASTCGIDGLILPDLPEYEFETQYSGIIRKHGLDFIFMVTPETPEDRVRQLDRLSTGFLYAVSSSSTTGSKKNMAGVNAYLERLSNYKLKNPILVGFGIKDKETFNQACQHASGAVIGTAYIKSLENNRDVKAATKSFLSSILN